MYLKYTFDDYLGSFCISKVKALVECGKRGSQGKLLHVITSNFRIVLVNSIHILFRISIDWGSIAVVIREPID